jgi:hypothetical protein
MALVDDSLLLFGALKHYGYAPVGRHSLLRWLDLNGTLILKWLRSYLDPAHGAAADGLLLAGEKPLLHGVRIVATLFSHRDEGRPATFSLPTLKSALIAAQHGGNRLLGH